MDEFNRRTERTEERISEPEEGTSKSEQHKENRLQKKPPKQTQSPRDLWYYNKRANICVIRVLEGEEK